MCDHYKFSSNERLVSLILRGLDHSNLSSDVVSNIVNLIEMDSSLHFTFGKMVNDYFNFKMGLEDYDNGKSDEMPDNVPYRVPDDIVVAVDNIYDNFARNKTDNVAVRQDLDYQIALLIDRHNKRPKPIKPNYQYEKLSLDQLKDKIKKIIPEFNASNPQRLKAFLERYDIEEASIDEGGFMENLLRLHDAICLCDFKTGELDTDDDSDNDNDIENNGNDDSFRMPHKFDGLSEDQLAEKIRELAPGKYGKRIHPMIIKADLRKFGAENIDNLSVKEMMILLIEYLSNGQ